MDAGEAAILAAAVGILGTIAGIALQPIIGRQTAREDRESREKADREARTRESNLAALDQTVRDMTAHLRAMTQLASGVPTNDEYGPDVQARVSPEVSTVQPLDLGYR
jgi:hypothetical protein